MKSTFYSSKDEIRNRVIKNAMDFWGVRNVNDLDPLVKLLLEALCTELFNLSNELRNVENRVMERMSAVLASDILTAPLPAHAIMHARPVEPVELLPEGSHFSYLSSEKQELYFTPLQPVKLFNVKLKYMCTADSFFELNDTWEKDLLLNAESRVYGAGERTKIWLGIDSHEEIGMAEDWCFYFDWRDYQVDDEVYPMLALSKWMLGEEEIRVKPGLPGENSRRYALLEEQDLIHQITEDIQAHYHNRFLHTGGKVRLTDAIKQVPDELKEAYGAKNLGFIKKPVVWISVELPPSIPAALGNELHISMNAFPVMNRRLCEEKDRLSMINYIIPVKTGAGEFMLSIDQLADNTGKSYKQVSHARETRQEGTYTVRYGGVERFDTRNAQEMIDYLFELLRDEKVAFSIYGADFLTTNLRSLNQGMALIEQRIRNVINQLKESINYIVINPDSKASLFFLTYWLTCGAHANGIKSGSVLQQLKGSSIVPESIRLLTYTIGGRNRLNASERIHAYKYGLTTRDRIATRADVVHFCFYELGSKITRVDIKKGLLPGKLPREGFKKTIDIYITPAKEYTLSNEDWQVLLGLLKSKLQQRSLMTAHFRVLLNKQAGDMK